MAYNKFCMIGVALATFLLPYQALAATVTYDLDISWLRASPDGFERSVIGVNGQWPPPVLYGTKGDQFIVNVQNSLGNESTSLHFHGMFQNGTTHMDGSVGATQCPIPAGSKFTYNFTLVNSGTFWYHSHLKGQYPEGLRAPLIIRDPDMPFKNNYTEELILSLSDWYHTPMADLSKAFLSITNPSGAEPVPDSVLMNDTSSAQVKVQPGKTYLLRLVNMGAFAAQRFWIEGHTMRIVEVDGVWTEPTEAKMLYFTVAQRYSVLVTTKNDTSTNFAMVTSMDEDLFDQIPAGLNPNATSYLVYDASKPMPQAALVDAWTDYDDATLVPHSKEKRLPKPDLTLTLDVKMDNLGDGANYAFFSDSTYVMPKVPSLFSAMTLGDAATNPAVYGANSNPYVLEKGQIVEIVINNNDPGKHPFHLHGHNFQVISRSAEEAGAVAANVTDEGTSDTPIRRDTISVWPNGNARLRFVADNPGLWLFHCHIEWHTVSGLIASFIEAPLELQKILKIPEDHYAACKKLNIPTAGNAAGNTQNPLDLTGANVSPPPLPAGFTARGIVALVFSCVAAFVGCAVISWYGSASIKK